MEEFSLKSFILNNRDGHNNSPNYLLQKRLQYIRNRIRSSYIHTPLSEKRTRKGIAAMGDVKLFRNNMTLPPLFGGGNETKSPPFEIEDTFENSTTKSLLYGKNPTVYHKNIIMSVLHVLSSTKTPQSSSRFESNLQAKQQIHEFIRQLMGDETANFDTVKQAFKSKSMECMLAYALLAYQSDDDDLMLRTMYTFGRVLPLKEKTQWFDNYRLNAYGNVFNLTMYTDHVKKLPMTEQNKESIDHIYDAVGAPADINKSIVIPTDTAEKLVNKLVGKLRVHILTNGLLPDKDNTTRLLTVADIRKNAGKSSPSAITLLDNSYLHYPFYYGGCHGCDCFDLGLTPTISELKLFLDRYPSARIGFILNTATYRSGRGQHWMALMLMKNRALLMCSQQGTFDDFLDDGKLKQSLIDNNFTLENNNVKLQSDNHSCGMQSVIALLEMIRFGEIKNASDAIGSDMSNLGKDIGKECSTETVIEKLAGAKQ